MHELPITQQIIKIAEYNCRVQRGKQVTEICLVLGDDTSFIVDTIQMYFDVISKGTMCEGAIITVQRVKPLLRCRDCGALFERIDFSFECPICFGLGQPTEVGKECYVKSIEVKT